MNTDTIIQLLGYIMTPIAGVVTWFVSGRVRNNNTLNELQKTIDMLVVKNNELIAEITQLRQENAELRAGQVELKSKIEQLQDRKQLIKIKNTRTVNKERK